MNAIAERLVARVGFTLKPTGPERGTSKAESQRGGPGGWKGVQEGPQAHNAPALPCPEDSPLEK